MSFKLSKAKIVILLGLVLIGGAVAVVTGYWYLRSQRDADLQARRTHADELFEQEEWLLAKRNYALYLQRYPDDIEALYRYA